MVYDLPPGDPIPRRYPKVPLDRRAYAFGIDLVSVWFLSSFAGMNWLLQFNFFLIIWFLLRVLVVAQNKGQSLGRWALDMKVIDARLSRVPGIYELTRREAIVGVAAALTMVGAKAAFGNPLTFILLSSPLVTDCSVAIGDEEHYRTFHDRFAGTIVIPTRRGLSLDLRLKRLWYEIERKRGR